MALHGPDRWEPERGALLLVPGGLCSSGAARPQFKALPGLRPLNLIRKGANAIPKLCVVFHLLAGLPTSRCDPREHPVLSTFILSHTNRPGKRKAELIMLGDRRNWDSYKKCNGQIRRNRKRRQRTGTNEAYRVAALTTRRVASILSWPVSRNRHRCSAYQKNLKHL